MEDDAELFVYLLDLMFDVSVSLDEIQKLDLDQRLLQVWEKEKKISKRLPNLNVTQLRRIYDITSVNNQAMWNYKPQSYPGQITFFHAKERDNLLAKNPELAWVDLAGSGIEVKEVPGNHFTMNYSPHVQVMAKQLRPYLA
ncbi:MAG TPA: hypothetical protein EYP59_03535 [Thiotrichaceae bacterium]|nr:hypothetical protein [Thiotrichaceae bacterium]